MSNAQKWINPAMNRINAEKAKKNEFTGLELAIMVVIFAVVCGVIAHYTNIMFFN